jgi:hypothetical protein
MGLSFTSATTKKDYRKFSEIHLDQVRLIRMMMKYPWMGGMIRNTAYQIIFQCREGDLGGALENAYRLRVHIQVEIAQAEAAAEFLEQWALGNPIETRDQPRAKTTIWV